MSDRIVESLNEMKQIYLESVSGLVISERDEYLQYIEEKNKKMKKGEDEKEEDDTEEDDEEEDDEENDDGDKPKRWWDDDGDGVGYEKGEVGGSFKKKKKMDESFSDWRSELYEKVGDVEADIEDSKRQIKERSNIKNTVEINPNINIGESVELSEEYIEDVIDIASEYFYEQGLNEEGLLILAEELGEEELLEWVFEIGANLIGEAAMQGELLTAKGTARKSPKITKQVGAATPVKHTTSKEKEEKSKSPKQSPGQLSLDFDKARKRADAGTKIKDDKRNTALRTAASSQTTEPATRRHRRHGKVVPGARPSTPKPQEKTTQTSPAQVSQSEREARIQGIKKGIGSALKDTANVVGRAGLAAWKGHEKAMKEKGEGSTLGKQLSRGLKTAAAAFVKKGTEHLKEDFVDWIHDVLNEGIDISDWSISELYEQFITITEKAESEQQQKLFGLALSIKRGETPRSEASKEVLEIVDGMSEAKIRKFAKTKHKGLPRKKED